MSLAEGWAPYFPDVPEGEEEDFDYPPLFSERFWTGYAEPIDEFMWTAGSFALSVSSIQLSLHPNPCLLSESVRPAVWRFG